MVRVFVKRILGGSAATAATVATAEAERAA
jgi:hypothetical protein